MTPERLQAIVEEADGSRVVRAPGVGWWSNHPPSGCSLDPGSGLGFLRRLHRIRLLVLPAGQGGRVDSDVRARIVPVEYGEALFRLVEVASHALRDEASAAATTDAGGALAVTAPTDGVFYRRPAPDAPAFVEAGQRIRTGQPVGLVEVMKTFNQIVYGGPGLPEEAEVLRVCCEDSEEVSAGQPLVLVR